MRVVILDHGYVELIEHWGSDERIVEVARMSTDKGFLGWGGATCQWCGKKREAHIQVNTTTVTGIEVVDNHGLDTNLACTSDRSSQFWTPHIETPGDEKLLARLIKHKHTSPFEMAGLVIEVKAPIFVFREWHRHRTQSYNELSARYTPMPDESYVPTVDRCMQHSTTNKQAARVSGAPELMGCDAAVWLEKLEALYQHAEAVYSEGLRIGVPKEVARLAVTVARYSRMRASANLHNWLRFLSLRLPEDAQLEIRLYAQEVAKLVEQLFPRTWELYANRE